MTSILTSVQDTLGPDLLQRIQECKILLVGAGGIGCELLKNLALTGFRHVEIIDLDTIDVSNLNRQLLFRSQHVGQPKCTVAAKVAATLAVDNSNDITYTAHHGNVCDNTKFNVPFVQQFHLVLNALDNVTARRRVNRLCLAANVPLVEAGTTGYLGQVNVIARDVACYECTTQEQQKVYPICTIRATPSMPVHTIVWSKELYKLLFGEKVEESVLYESSSSEDDPSTYMSAVLEFRAALQKAKEKSATTDAIDIAKLVEAVVTKLYVDELQKQLDMDRYKTARKKPVVLSADIIQQGVNSTGAPTRSASYSSTTVWSPAECVAELVACCQDAWQDPDTILPSFDKDDDVAMRLVTAASNLRSFVFGIEPLQSLYAAKGIAGNIIPAIATTNAICAGLQILQAFHILKSQMDNDAPSLRDSCRYINCIRNKTRNGLYLTAVPLNEPNPKCFVCRSASVPVTLTVSKWTLGDLLNRVVKKDLGFEEPTIMINGGDCIWEEGEDSDQALFEQNLPKLLTDLPCGGVQHGSVVTIEDFTQDLTVNVTVMNRDVWEATEDGEPDEFKFVIGGSVPVAKKVEAGNGKENNGADEDDDDDDDDICVIVTNNNNGKRSVTELDEEPAAKKVKQSMEADVIEIE